MKITASQILFIFSHYFAILSAYFLIYENDGILSFIYLNFYLSFAIISMIIELKEKLKEQYGLKI